MEMRDVQLTPEVKKKLENCLAFRIHADFKYVPQVFRENKIPKELWPVFTLRGLSAMDYAFISDSLLNKIEPENTKIKPAMSAILSCKLGIMGWKNYKDEDSIEVPSPKEDLIDGGIALEAVKRIPMALIYELADAISNESKLTEEELAGLE